MIQYFDLTRLNNTYGDQLTQAATRVMRSGWYVLGNEVKQFEHEYAQYVGTRYCITCGNGLDALTAILIAWRQMYGWNDGDEVILPDNTFIATALATKSLHSSLHAHVPSYPSTSTAKWQIWTPSTA